MKKLLSISFLFLWAFQTKSQTNILHLNLGSHNEMSDPAHGVNYNTNYSAIKSKALQVADSVNVNFAKWNMQVESNFIRACLQFDNANTNSNNLMLHMDNLDYVEVDPHNHLDTVVTSLNYNPYNYSDLNHLLDSCGLGTRTNVGGFIYKGQDWATSDENWTIWKNGLHGRTFSNSIWTPTVLWGGGTLNHVNDPNPIGVWHPGGASTLSFLTNNPNQLMDIGNGCAWLIKDTTNVENLISEIDNYLTAINASIPTTNTFYTATIMFDFRDILTAGYVEKIAEVLRKIKPFVNDGKVVWQTLSEKRNDWLSTHNNSTDFFVTDCTSLNVSIKENQTTNREILLYPNPSNDIINIDFSEKISNFNYSIFDILGTEITNMELKQINPSSFQINIQNLPNGIYQLRLNDGWHRFIKG